VREQPALGDEAAPSAGLRPLHQRRVLRADLVVEREELRDPVLRRPGREEVVPERAAAIRRLRLLAHDSPGRAALAHAGPAAVDVAAACQQVVGAIGFTLEFPLQRAYRRARAVALWADAFSS